MDYTRAIINFSKAIARNPNDAKLYESRAVCYFNAKDYVRSRRDAQKAKMLGGEVDSILLEAR